jgi:hypothetical protein
MTPLALAFLSVSWSVVLGVTIWAFWRILRGPPGSGG